MILLTGATGAVGSHLLPMLVERGERVKCLVRQPDKLGRHRVDVQIVMGDLKELSDPFMLRQSLRGVDSVIHLAGSLRDQPGHPVEELNGLATVRLVEAAEIVGANRFLFFSALGASPVQKPRFLRSKWTGQAAVEGSNLDSTVFRPSIVFDRSDPWVTLMQRLSFLPFMPVAGSGRSEFQPIWARNAAEAVIAALDAGPEAPETIDLAGPETLTYSEMSSLVAEVAGRPRPVRTLPLPLVRTGLDLLKAAVGPNVFATAEEAELMQVSMTSPEGDRDLQRLGIAPSTMAEVLSRQAQV